MTKFENLGIQRQMDCETIIEARRNLRYPASYVVNEGCIFVTATTAKSPGRMS